MSARGGVGGRQERDGTCAAHMQIIPPTDEREERSQVGDAIWGTLWGVDGGGG